MHLLKEKERKILKSFRDKNSHALGVMAQEKIRKTRQRDEKSKTGSERKWKIKLEEAQEQLEEKQKSRMKFAR